MPLRPATTADLPAIMQMYAHSRSVMRAAGNHLQWVGYPTEADALADIEAGRSLIIVRKRQPVGTVALLTTPEPTYGHIDHGRWLDPSTPYATLHRLAAADGAHGIAAEAFAYAKQQCSHLRADTHALNRAMQHILVGQGFVHCGRVYMDNGSPREAYEWWRFDEVAPSLRRYIDRYILPRYDHFDAAHRRDHALRVVARTMLLYRSLQPAMPSAACFYAAAALHDVGLSEGRERHHLASAHFIRHCRPLHQWFTDAEIEAIAQAAEDHRASAQRPPRSLLGCVVAEADRDIEPTTIVRRTVEYSLAHHPTFDREQHWHRCLDHLREKYGTSGYITLWLTPSPNAAPLDELRQLIADPHSLRSLFDELFTTLSATTTTP